MALIAHGPMLDRMKLKSVGILRLESTNENEGCERRSQDQNYWLDVALSGVAYRLKANRVSIAQDIEILSCGACGRASKGNRCDAAKS